MNWTSFGLPALLAAVTFASTAEAQVIVTPNGTTDRMVAFSPVDGSVISTNWFPISTATQVSAIQVNNEIWVSEQTATRIVRYDPCGTIVGTIGPTFTGGAINNIRGMCYTNGTVYVTNSGTTGGAPGNAVVMFDPAGNFLGQWTTTGFAPSPFSVIPFQGDLLVAGSSGTSDVYRFSLTGTPIGTFHDSSLSFAHQVNLASDGNVWMGVFTTGQVVKLDATSGAILTSFTASGARGVYELLNGNILWTSSSGAFVYDVGTMTSTQVNAGNHYHLNLVLPQVGACHWAYGSGCHTYSGDRSNVFELFADIASAKTRLDGNAMQFSLTPNGYVASWLPGTAPGLYVPPSLGAAIIADADSLTTTITPSAPIPIPGGTAAQWTVSSNGILTAGATGNQGTSGSPTLASTAAQTGLAFYTWGNHNPAEAGSGKIKWEEVGGMLLVTYDGVEFNGGTPTAAPSTFQFQVDMASGNVTMVWPSMSISNSTSDMLVGCTLTAAGLTPISQSLATVAGKVLQPDSAPIVPMSLAAAPFPSINPSTLVTYTADNVPEFVPGSGVRIGTMFFSVNPLMGGFDLNGILTTMPGCKAYIGTLDVDLGGTLSFGSTLSWNFTFDNVIFAPGNTIAAQAVALFDTNFPLANGEAGGFILSNGVLSTTN